MIITYPDAITHKAIIKTFCEYLNSAVATGTFVCPKLALIPGKELLVVAEPHEIDNPHNEEVFKQFGEFSNLIKSRIEKAMEF